VPAAMAKSATSPGSRREEPAQPADFGSGRPARHQIDCLSERIVTWQRDAMRPWWHRGVPGISAASGQQALVLA
jgi:hypothetical protein